MFTFKCSAFILLFVWTSKQLVYLKNLVNDIHDEVQEKLHELDLRQELGLKASALPGEGDIRSVAQGSGSAAGRLCCAGFPVHHFIQRLN